jgi:hypothetical protein
MRKSDFERIVDKTFWGLEAKYGFTKTATTYHRGGVTVRYQNPTTEVILNYEIGAYPWMTIADIKSPKTDKTSLDWLLVELGEKRFPTPDEAFFTAKMDEGQLEVELQKISDQLLKFGISLLKGDFTLLPKLQKRAEDYLSECKKFADKQNIKS